MNKLDFINAFCHIFSQNNLAEFAGEALAEKFYFLTERMLEVNAHMNLTAITDMEGIILKHYVDSLTASSYLTKNASVIDVGCGAGFPSLPLAIARPDLQITALDSTAKRINYIKETAEIMGLPNITCIAARAEELACDSSHREQYDISCARAVARMNVLCEFCLPYVKPGGKFIAMKANAAEELEEAVSAIKKLGGKQKRADFFSLISDAETEPNPRCIIEIEKISPTPENYPRNHSQIKKKPL